MEAGGGFCSAACCESCGNLSYSAEWFTAFGVALCHQCKQDEALIAKGAALQLYMLTERDLRGLGCIAKDNPQKKGWTPMKLYLRSQVEERARRKHGDLDQLRQARSDRTTARLETKMRGLAGTAAAAAAAGKRRRGGGAAGEEAGEGSGDGEEEVVEGDGPPKQKLTAAALKVRARLASEYEAKGRGVAVKQERGGAACGGGAYGGEGPGVRPAEEDVAEPDVEVF